VGFRVLYYQFNSPGYYSFMNKWTDGPVNISSNNLFVTMQIFVYPALGLNIAWGQNHAIGVIWLYSMSDITYSVRKLEYENLEPTSLVCAGHVMHLVL
jgi:hypothetical protein